MKALICLDARDWERVIRGVSRYSSEGGAILAHVVDERAPRGFDLSMRGLLGRRQRRSETVTPISETAAEELLADAEALLGRLSPDLSCQRLVLQGIPEQELARTAQEERVDAVFVGRGTPGSGTPVTVSGTLAGWKRNHHGDLDGFYLDDGSEVHFPPHRADGIQEVVREGVRVEARGERRGGHIHAFIVTNPESEASTEAHRPPPAGEPEKRHLGHTARFVTDHVSCDVIILL